MDLPRVAWREFEAAAPDIASAGQRLLEDAPGVPGVAFLGTLGADGVPRIHPFIPSVQDGGLWAFVIESPKQRDLDRGRWFAVHSRLGEHDESFFCAGGATRTTADEVRSRVAGRMPYHDIDERHVLYEFHVARALWTRWPTPTTPVHRRWTWRDH